MSPAITVFIMMNNYFHDVATAMLMACGITMSVIMNRSEKRSCSEVTSFLLWIYSRISKVVTLSLIWITVSAIPRILTFKSFEWPHAFSRHHESGLIAKYILALIVLFGGLFLWASVSRKMLKVRLMYEAEFHCNSNKPEIGS